MIQIFCKVLLLPPLARNWAFQSVSNYRFASKFQYGNLEKPLALEFQSERILFAQGESQAHMLFDSIQCTRSYVSTVLFQHRPVWNTTNCHIFKSR